MYGSIKIDHFSSQNRLGLFNRDDAHHTSYCVHPRDWHHKAIRNFVVRCLSAGKTNVMTTTELHKFRSSRYNSMNQKTEEMLMETISSVVEYFNSTKFIHELKIPMRAATMINYYYIRKGGNRIALSMSGKLLRSSEECSPYIQVPLYFSTDSECTSILIRLNFLYLINFISVFTKSAETF